MISELGDVIQSYKRIKRAWTSDDKSTDAYLAATCLLEFPTYRLLQRNDSDPFIGFRLIYRALLRFRAEQKLTPSDSQSKAMIFGGHVGWENHSIRLIERSSGSRVFGYISKDRISFKDQFSIPLIARWLWFAIGIAIQCMRKGNRQGRAMLIVEVLEIAWVLNFVREHKMELVYDYVPYEIDSNWMYLLLRERGYRVIKVPSSVPLAIHNWVLMADAVVLTTPYQIEESKRFKSTFRVKEFYRWLPEKLPEYEKLYFPDQPKTEPKTLGFYSHGEWHRGKDNKSVFGHRIGETERKMLNYLGRFTQAHPEYTLRIFPHPREREDVEKMRQFYQRAIGHHAFEISVTTGGTSNHFHDCDIAVVVFSTILYERLFCGFKTLIGNADIQEFPMNLSSLDAICFRTYDELSDLILTYSEVDNPTFFAKTGIADYESSHYRQHETEQAIPVDQF
ncbi:MAG: hypothetical protein ACKO6L_01415 [Flavobacteriales bacterium]